MTTIESTPGYKQLALDSSNDMIRYDSLWVQGDYSEAAWHVRRAALARQQMGQIQFETGEFADAAEDWLSAAECFYLATDLKKMQECIEGVRQLERMGHIPANRSEITETLAEREEQLLELDRRIRRYRLDYDQLIRLMPKANQETLRFLIRQIQELPGFPYVYAQISSQAQQLGNRSLAIESLDWAIRFDPSSRHLGALRASQLFMFGEPLLAVQACWELLALYPDMGYVRFLLAQATAFRQGTTASESSAADWREALDILRPQIDRLPDDPLEGLLGLALAVALEHGLGHELEYRRLLNAFDDLAQTTRIPQGIELVSKVRQVQPHVFCNSGLEASDISSLRQVLQEFNPLVAEIAI